MQHFSLLQLLAVALAAGAGAAAEQPRRPVVNHHQYEEQHDHDPHRRTPDAVDGVGRAGAEGEDVGEHGGAAVVGEDADDEDEADGKQQEPHGLSMSVKAAVIASRRPRRAPAAPRPPAPAPPPSAAARAAARRHRRAGRRRGSTARNNPPPRPAPSIAGLAEPLLKRRSTSLARARHHATIFIAARARPRV